MKNQLGSLKVIETDTYGSAIYDFLLTFHSNYWPISYRFRNKQRFQSTIAKFSHPRLFFAHAERVSLGIGYRRLESKKLEWRAYGRRKKFDDIFSRLDTIHQRDRRTDGQSDTGRQQRPRLRLASRGKTDYAVWVKRYYHDRVIYCSERFKLEFHFHSCFVLAVYAGFKNIWSRISQKP